jgi:hypothetical protein
MAFDETTLQRQWKVTGKASNGVERIATPAATRWQTRERIPARCRLIWATAASNQPCATPSWREGGLRTCGGADMCAPRLQPARLNAPVAFAANWRSYRRFIDLTPLAAQACFRPVR